MNHRITVLLTMASMLACRGLVRAEAVPPTLSIDPIVMADAAAAPDRAPLMGLLDKAGAAKPLEDAGINLYGWVESGYTYNHRHHGQEPAIMPGPFNHEVGNHYMLNQVDLRIEKQIADPKKFDVGGMVEVMYGTDGGFIHSSGMGFNGNDPTDDGVPTDGVADKYRAFYQFDVTQAYVDVSLPVGNGLTIRMGKFATLLGNETIAPVSNAFYSHSWIFNALPFTQTGILAIAPLTDQWSVMAGVSRGWDMTLEDPNGAIDGLGQILYKPTSELSVALNWSVGPQNFGDAGHYRTVVDPIVTWKATKDLTLTLEGLYLYDGGLNQPGPLGTHAYGDAWGGALYGSYVVNDYVTANARVEKFHSLAGNFGGLAGVFEGVPTSLNVYSFTVGVTVTPLPKDATLKNLTIRPEMRYDVSEDEVFAAHGGAFKDEITFGADVIFKF